MLRMLTAAIAILAFAGHCQAQGDPIFSGPQPGEKLTAFKVQVFAGPSAGKEVDLVGDAKETPRVLIFVHEITRPAFQLLKPVDQYAATLAGEGLELHHIWLTGDKAKTEQFLQGANKSLALMSPIVISLDGIEGPGNYGLNRKVTVTVLVAKGNKVVANFAIVQPNETDAPKVNAAIAKMMGKSPPAVIQDKKQDKRIDKDKKADKAVVSPQITELEAQLRKMTARNAELEKYINFLTESLNEAREQIAKLEGKPAPKPLPPLPKAENKGKDKVAGKASANPDLQQLMRKMIQPTNDDEAVQSVAAEMLKWAGNDPARVDELREYCRFVSQLGYGTDAAKKALAKLAQK